MDHYRIKNGKIVLKDSILDGHDIIVDHGIIADIARDRTGYTGFDIIDAEGAYISPGLVEMHIHGCGGYGFDDAENRNIFHILDFLSARGINTFIPTFLPDREKIRRMVRQIKSSDLLKKKIPGIYIEGPFINKEKKGGIPPEYIHEPDLFLLKQIIRETEGLLKLMTVAPEKKGNREIFDYLKKNGIIPCLGHSDCNLGNVFAMDGAGPVGITHLFNAMSGISHKKTGLAMLPFLNRDLFFELNGDGIHVNDDLITICYQQLNRERCILISDAAIAAGLEYGEYVFYSKQVISDATGVRYKEGNLLMGANMLVDDILKRFIRLTGAPLYEAIRFISYNPCRFLGIDSRRGSIEKGKEADLILLDDEYNVIRNLTN